MDDMGVPVVMSVGVSCSMVVMAVEEEEEMRAVGGGRGAGVEALAMDAEIVTTLERIACSIPMVWGAGYVHSLVLLIFGE